MQIPSLLFALCGRNSALYQAAFGSVHHLGLPDAVDGPTAPTPVEIAPAVASQEVKALLPMELDVPVDLGMQDFCRKCLKCAENCPAGAIPRGEPMVVRGVRKWKIVVSFPREAAGT